MSERIHLVALVNKRKSVNAAFSFLEGNGCDIIVVSSTNNLVKSLSEKRPHAVLLSWNFRGIDPLKVYEILTKKFDVPCVVFPEELDRNSNASLMSSGIPDFLLSPVSGPSLLARVRTHAGLNNKGYKIKSNVDQNQSSSGNYYLVKGGGKNAPIEFVHERAMDVMTSFEDDLRRQILSGEIKYEVLSDIDVSVEGLKGQEPSVLAKAVKTSYIHNAHLHVKSIDENTQVSKISLSTISSKQFHGYLVCVSSDDSHQSKILKRSNNIVADELRSLGDVVLTPIQILEIEIDRVNFLNWVRSQSDFFVTSKKTGIAMAFFTDPHRPEMKEEGEHFALKIENDLQLGKKVGFDLYLHLPNNKKYLKYLKKGQVFSDEIAKKFLDKGLSQLHVDQTDRKNYLTYLAENFMSASISKVAQELLRHAKDQKKTG